MIRKALIELKKKSLLDQQQMAELSGIPKQRISEWVLGRRKLKLENLVKIANAIGYEIEIKILKKQS